MNIAGSVVRSLTLSKEYDSDDSFFNQEFLGSFRSYPLVGHNAALFQAHHSDSSGGYDYFAKVDLSKKAVTPSFPQTIEGVSPDGSSFIGVEYDWYGGWKSKGAEKLCRLYVWAAKSLTKKQVGFRYMKCEGACFVEKPSK